MWCIAALISASAGRAAEPGCGDGPPLHTIDPIFKLDLPERFYAAHFTPAQAAMLRRCGELVSETAGYKYWIFAETDTPSGHAVALGGMTRADPAAAWVPDPFGALVLDHANGDAASCRAISWPLDVFCTPDLPGGAVPRATLDALAADAVQRYTAAFGSKATFVAALRQQHRYPADPRLPFLAKAVAGRAGE